MDRMIRQAEKKKHKEDTKTRPRPIPGWPVEPEIFTELLFKRRKSQKKKPYLVRHPKMDLKQEAINAGLGHDQISDGARDNHDFTKVTIAVETYVDTPRPAHPHQVYSNQELIDLRCKELIKILYSIFCFGNDSQGIVVRFYTCSLG